MSQKFDVYFVDYPDGQDLVTTVPRTGEQWIRHGLWPLTPMFVDEGYLVSSHLNRIALANFHKPTEYKSVHVTLDLLPGSTPNPTGSVFYADMQSGEMYLVTYDDTDGFAFWKRELNVHGNPYSVMIASVKPSYVPTGRVTFSWNRLDVLAHPYIHGVSFYDTVAQKFLHSDGTWNSGNGNSGLGCFVSNDATYDKGYAGVQACSSYVPGGSQTSSNIYSFGVLG